MSTFQLTIVTPDGEYFRGPAESLTVRATTGELTLLPRHIDFVTALGMGEARVTIDQVDLPRAKDALARAESALENPSLSKEERRVREAAKRRAQVRISVAENHK